MSLLPVTIPPPLPNRSPPRIINVDLFMYEFCYNYFFPHWFSYILLGLRPEEISYYLSLEIKVNH